MKKIFMLTNSERNDLLNKINKLQNIAYEKLDTAVVAKERTELLNFHKTLEDK